MFYNDMQHINGKDGYTVDLKEEWELGWFINQQNQEKCFV